jgi:ABC-type multidrug transport system ATPase subunit
MHLHQSSEAAMSTFTPNELTHPFTPPANEVAGLTNAYGEVEAVGGVSFTVARGEVVGFLGPNKSTTINMLCMLARPTSGTARASGLEVAGKRDDVRRYIGLVEALKASVGAELVAAQSGTVAAAAEGCDALIAAVVMPAGVWL